jgi:hypothetical protein
VKKSFNIQELLHSKFKHHGIKPMHPSLLRAFQRHQEHDLRHPGSVDLITAKQNKLPSLINRLASSKKSSLGACKVQMHIYVYIYIYHHIPGPESLCLLQDETNLMKLITMLDSFIGWVIPCLPTLFLHWGWLLDLQCHSNCMVLQLWWWY